MGWTRPWRPSTSSSQLLPGLCAEGLGKLGTVTSKTGTGTGDLALARFPAVGELVRRLSAAHEEKNGKRHKPDPHPLLLALEKLAGLRRTGRSIW